ncbi:MAG: M20/M25/M40 family metallo-hydrolase [Clostridia bacterium]|nr:M20/M25/M40 family metallo-hydrolase [Clostridia bacterium]
MFNLTKKILKPVSVSGREEAVVGVIAEEIAPYVDSMRTDAMGNLIAFKAGIGENKKKLMYAAHIDEIGFIVSYIEENGYIRFHPIGGINFTSAAFTHVVFENGQRGVLVPEGGDLRAEKCVVDIGAKSRKDAERRVKIGDTFSVVADIAKLANNRVAGRPMDDRIGAVILIEAAKRLAGKDVYNDVYFVFTVQEEVGCRGSKTAAYSVMPDVGIALDVTRTGDAQGSGPMAISLGDGAAIKIKDSSVVCDRDLVEKMKAAAKENKIKYQLEILAGGGTDTSSMQSNAGGAIAGCISIPTRYIHSSVETIDMADVDACVKLTMAMCDVQY